MLQSGLAKLEDIQPADRPVNVMSEEGCDREAAGMLAQRKVDRRCGTVIVEVEMVAAARTVP